MKSTLRLITVLLLAGFALGGCKKDHGAEANPCGEAADPCGEAAPSAEAMPANPCGEAPAAANPCGEAADPCGEAADPCGEGGGW